MPEGTTPGKKRTCFVVMGFGKKTDFETGRTLDLDKTYRNIIKPAAEAAGLECVRADEIVHSGLIDVPMYERLLNADVVVADLSTSNKNAFYELGVRHALRPFTTIVIAEDGIKQPLPFDVNRVLIRMYHHLGEDIGFDEVMRFRSVLTEAINGILNNDPPPCDSPVYTFINGLVGPKLGSEGDAKAVADALGGAATTSEAAMSGESHSALMSQVEEAEKRGDFLTAKVLLQTIRTMMKAADPNRPDDPCVIHGLAHAVYKSGLPTPQAALEEARQLLTALDPATSNDPETLGLWGAVHKRLWYVTGDTAYLDEAVRSYERGFYIRNDYYNGINLAFLLNVCAAAACQRADAAATAEAARAERAEAVTCFVHAVRVRREVIEICKKLLAEEGLAGEQKYWVLATMAEAYLGTGDEAAAEAKLQEAFAMESEKQLRETTEQQMDKLHELLAKSPLDYIRSGA